MEFSFHFFHIIYYRDLFTALFVVAPAFSQKVQCMEKTVDTFGAWSEEDWISSPIIRRGAKRLITAIYMPSKDTMLG